MKILKEQLKTLWYEDENGNKIDEMPCEENGFRPPTGACYQVSRFPLTLRTKHVKLLDQAEVDKCSHPRGHIVPTYGWVDGIVGRQCTLCQGTQVKKKWRLWPRTWQAHGSREVATFECTWNNEEVVIAMVNSGDYTLKEAIIIYATACERCVNVLTHKYTGGKDGYKEHSEEWKKANTYCEFCESEEE